MHHTEIIATKYLYEFAVCFVERAPNDFIFEVLDVREENFYAMCWRVLLITPPRCNIRRCLSFSKKLKFFNVYPHLTFCEDRDIFYTSVYLGNNHLVIVREHPARHDHIVYGFYFIRHIPATRRRRSFVRQALPKNIRDFEIFRIFKNSKILNSR